MARRLDPSGSTIEEEIVVSSELFAQNEAPLAAIDEAGNFVVAWAFRTPDESESGIRIMRFDAAGRPVGTETVIKSGPGEVLHPALIEFDQGQIKLGIMSESAAGEISLVQQTFAAGGA